MEKEFKAFELTSEKIELFKKLRGEVAKEISDRLLCIIVTCKKTYEKCINCAKAVKLTMDEVGFGNLKITQPLFHAYHNRFVQFDPSYRTKDGLYVMIVDSPAILKSKVLSREEKIKLLMFHFQSICMKYPEITTKGLVVFSLGSNLSMSDFDFKLAKTMQKHIKNLPIRPRRILIHNAPWYIRLILAISKPFMSKKILSRIGTCTNEDVKNYLDEKIIPPEMGGKKQLDAKKNLLEVFCNGDKKIFEEFLGKVKTETIDEETKKKVEKDRNLSEEEKKKIEEEFMKKNDIKEL